MPCRLLSLANWYFRPRLWALSNQTWCHFWPSFQRYHGVCETLSHSSPYAYAGSSAGNSAAHVDARTQTIRAMRIVPSRIRSPVWIIRDSTASFRSFPRRRADCQSEFAQQVGPMLFAFLGRKHPIGLIRLPAPEADLRKHLTLTWSPFCHHTAAIIPPATARGTRHPR